jgi:DNA repair photolyase
MSDLPGVMVLDAAGAGAGRPTSFGRADVTYVEVASVLTPASGFMRQYRYTLNPYGGCGFGCGYCYARNFTPSAAKQDGWGGWVAVKHNAAALVAEACRSGELRSGDAIYMSSVTDPYQPIERRAGLTRAILETLLEHGVQPRLTIQTRGPLVVRDIDLLRRFERLRVNVTITTDCDEVRRRYEQACPSIERRFEAVAALAEAGVRIGVSVSPMLPLADVDAFGVRLAALDAEEYVTQYLKPPRPRFRYAAGTTAEALRQASEDGWTRPEYERARARLAAILGPARPLLEGAEGYAPA